MMHPKRRGVEAVRRGDPCFWFSKSDIVDAFFIGPRASNQGSQIQMRVGFIKHMQAGALYCERIAVEDSGNQKHQDKTFKVLT
jgi:hypothetical protein